MAFSFGGSKSTTVSSSESLDRSQAGSLSGGAAVSQSEQRVAFEDIFARMFGGAEGAAGGLDPSMLTEAANALFSGGTGFMQSIGADAGSSYLAERLGGENQVLEDQIGLLGEDLGKFFNEELLPGITTDAIGGGQLGGGRQGVAQGRAVDMVGEQFRRGATDLRMGDIAARDSAAGVLAQNTVQGAQVGLAGISPLAGVADMGFGAALSPYERLAQIIGGPVTLTSAGSSSADFARSFSESFGSSRSSSTTKSKGLKMGFGE